MARKRQLLLRALTEYLRGSMWFLPAVAVVVAIVVAQLVSRITLPTDSVLDNLLLVDAEGARGVVTTVAAAVITVTGLVFSLMVVSLQLASQQFSPRLLRTFLRDRGTQGVLSVFLATFAYSMAVLPSIRNTPEPAVPEVAVAGAFVLALASVTALVYFVHHATVEIRVDTMMRDVEAETRETIDYVYPHRHGNSEAAGLATPPPAAVPLPAGRAGFLQDVSLAALTDAAREYGVNLSVHVPVGDYVVDEGPLVWAWRRDGRELEDEARAAVADAVAGALQIGHERTIQGDVAFGLRQLVDIAVKALSPAINDPTTAVHAIDRLTSLMCVLAGRRLEPRAGHDLDGNVVAVVPSRGFDEFLDLACGQIRRFGAGEPAITSGLMNMLSTIAGAAVDQDARACLRWEADLVLRAAQSETRQPEDLRPVEAAEQRLQRALSGDQRP